MRPIRTCLAAAFLIGAAQSPAEADCTCRARGLVAMHGQTVCIPTPQGARLARCTKVSNIASWQFLNAPCPLAAVGLSIAVTAAAPVLQQSNRIVR